MKETNEISILDIILAKKGNHYDNRIRTKTSKST